MARTLVISLTAALALAGCARQPPPPPEQSPAAPSPAAAATARSPNSAPWAGHVLRGSDTASLRTYLANVQQIKPIRFEVRWNPATVAFSKEAALRSLRSVSHDGATFTFAAIEPAAAKLQVGSILWVWGLALRKVDAVSTHDGLSVAHTQPVALNEAIPDADIEFEAAVPAQNFLIGERAPPAPLKSARTRHSGGLIPALFAGGEPPSPAAAPGSGEPPAAPAGNEQPPPADDEDADDAQEQVLEGNAYTGTLGGMQYSIGYVPTADGALKMSLQSRDAEDDAGSGDSGDASDDTEKKYKEAEAQAKAARDAIRKARQDDWNDEEEVRKLDITYEQQLAQMKQDDLDRHNPNYSGPTPPARPTDSNGTPYTEKALEEKLTQQYEQQRSLAVKKLAARREILAQWEAKKEEAERQKRLLRAAGKMVKQLFSIVSDNVDVRFKIDAEFKGFKAAGKFVFVGGDVQQAQMQFKDVSGKVKAAFIGRLGKPGNKGLKIPIAHVPVSFNVPLVTEGLPFVVQLGGDFLLTVFLAGNHASLSVNGEYAFDGASGFTYSKASAAVTDTTTISGSQPELTGHEGASLGVSAVVLGVQLPRLGLGVGVTGYASSVGYFDVVHVLTMTQSADAAAGMLAPRCKRMTYAATGHVGVETEVPLIPIEFIQKFASDKLSGKKEVFKREKELLDPPVKGCEI